MSDLKVGVGDYGGRVYIRLPSREGHNGMILWGRRRRRARVASVELTLDEARLLYEFLGNQLPYLAR